MNVFRFVSAISLLVTLAVAGGCAPGPGPGEEPEEFETVDVEPAENLEVDLSQDRKAKPRAQGGGQLPGDFPPSLPVFKPSTIADIGQGGLGGYVQFRARAGESEVKNWYKSALASAGWSVETAPGGMLMVSRDGRQARISIERPGPVTVVRIDY